jgi:hypothetical protein
MKIKILEINEVNGVLRIETECEYGKDKLGLSLEQKYLDPLTNEPRYLAEVKKLLMNKYEKSLATKKEVDKDNWGKEISTE